MVKLTPELINNAFQHVNPVKDRELDLRGYKISVIENLGATLNQFDTLDLSDNDIRKVDNFPLLPRLTNLLFNSNRIIRISDTLNDSLPNLHTLILTNNMIQELGEIDNLVKLSKLRTLSLLFNPVATKEHYRAYVVYKLPQLKLLDFKKIKMKEQDEAKVMFKSKEGKEIRKQIAKEIGASADDEVIAPKRVLQTSAEVAAIRKAIASATNLQEIERLNQILLSGKTNGLGLEEEEMES